MNSFKETFHNYNKILDYINNNNNYECEEQIKSTHVKNYLELKEKLEKPKYHEFFRDKKICLSFFQINFDSESETITYNDKIIKKDNNNSFYIKTKNKQFEENLIKISNDKKIVEKIHFEVYMQVNFQ